MVPTCAIGSGRTALSNFSSDISSRNIAFTCNKVLSSPGQELFDVRGSLKVDPLPRKDRKQPEKLAQPSILRVPETIFTDRFDYRLDLWRAGCIHFGEDE
ncbi:hypothetical protein N7455_008914 [Penicillium solitum]|uniref:uncharacterized protein n=1 Tax=Penicillium solitum TaxID=60172 RepID=UPI00179469DA|nr:hypothetical protein HAV15_008797 [Penicillium sp. str. \